MAVDKKSAANKAGLRASRIVVEVVIFLIQVLLPALITGAALYWVAGSFNLWKLDRTIALAIFAVLFILLSFIIVSFLSIPFSMGKTRRAILMRLVVMIVGGFIVPGLIFAGANLLYIAPGETYMARLIQVSVAAPVTVTTSPMSDAVIAAKSVNTKIEGIKAINSSHTPADLDQLFAILNNDPTDLTNQQVADALAQAIASYGTAAKPRLLAAFQQHARPGQTDTAKAPDSLYDRYFAPSIAGLQAQITAQPSDDKTRQDRLKQVTTLATQIQSGLADLQSETFISSQGDPVLDVALDACLQMNVTSDNDLYTFAKTTAADATLPEAVRGKALLLVAKVGSKDDLPFLYKYLSDSSEIVKASAFDAISTLNPATNPPVKSK